METARENSGANAETARAFLRMYPRIIWKETRGALNVSLNNSLNSAIAPVTRVRSVRQIHQSEDQG